MSGIYWGELACQPQPFELVWTVGFEPAVATIRVNRSQVLSWALRHDPQRFSGLLRGGQEIPLPRIAEQLRAAAPKRFEPVAELPTRAHLVVEEDGYPGIRVADMFLVEARVADAEGRDERKDDLELVLADPRRFWPLFGILGRDYNVPRGVAEDGTILYRQDTLRGGFRPSTAQEIAQDCLDALPGGGKIVRWPSGEFPVQTVYGRGALPLDVLRELTYRLELVYVRNLDGSSSFYRAGEDVQVGETERSLGGEVHLPYDPKSATGVWAGAVPDESNTYDHRLSVDAPDEVAIVCPPPVYTVQVDWLVPWVRLEQPDAEGGPPRVTSLEVTPDMLTRLGIEPNEDGTGLESWRLVKLPVLGGEWPEGFGAIPADLTEQLRGELWRRWRLPAELEHLLPFLARAERRDGQRLAPVVEAWGYAPIRVEVEREEAESIDVESDQRAAAELELQGVEERLARVRERIRRIEFTPADFVQAYRELVERLPALRRIGTQWIREGRLPNYADVAKAGLTAPETVDLLLKVSGALVRWQSELIGVDADALDPEGRALEALRQIEQGLVRRRLALLSQVDPARAIREQIQTLTDAYNKRLAAVGHDEAIWREILALQAELGRTAEQPQNRPKAKRRVTLVRHVNLPRRPVHYRIVGREIVLDEPSVWLRDPDVADPRETHVIPLPPRITFGTWNLARSENVQFPTLEPGQVSRNAFVNAAAKILSGAGLERFQVDLGNVLRPRSSSGPLVLTFTSSERTSGKAAVTFPLRVDATKDPAMQVLYELPTTNDGSGADNFAQVLERATKLADAYLSVPVREAGTITIVGPRPVNCSSRVSGVRWATSGDDGTVDTTISFDSESEPFPGVDRALPEGREQGPIVAGWDPRDPEDAA